MQISDRLRQERDRLGLTQSEIAKLCGVAFRTYCDYEAGKTEPKASFLNKIDKLGADVMYILTGDRTLKGDITSEEQRLIENYRAMDKNARLNIQAVGASFAKSEPLKKSTTN